MLQIRSLMPFRLFSPLVTFFSQLTASSQIHLRTIPFHYTHLIFANPAPCTRLNVSVQKSCLLLFIWLLLFTHLLLSPSGTHIIMILILLLQHFLPLDFSLEFPNLKVCAVHSERMSPSYSSFYSQDLFFASRFILFL